MVFNVADVAMHTVAHPEFGTAETDIRKELINRAFRKTILITVFRGV